MGLADNSTREPQKTAKTSDDQIFILKQDMKNKPQIVFCLRRRIILITYCKLTVKITRIQTNRTMRKLVWTLQNEALNKATLNKVTGLTENTPNSIRTQNSQQPQETYRVSNISTKKNSKQVSLSAYNVELGRITFECSKIQYAN